MGSPPILRFRSYGVCALLKSQLQFPPISIHRPNSLPLYLYLPLHRLHEECANQRLLNEAMSKQLTGEKGQAYGYV